MQIEQIVTSTPVMPVLVIEELEHAVPLAQALVAGGIKVLEITLRTPVALAAVEAIAKSVPDAIVGVGTLTRPEHFHQTADAGAQFAVSPGLTRVLLNASGQSELPFLPGVFTPSEAMSARDVGFEYLKLFPARTGRRHRHAQGARRTVSRVAFLPDRGIGANDFRDYLALDNVACVGGSWVAPAN